MTERVDHSVLSSFHHETVESSVLSSDPSIMNDKPISVMMKEEQRKKWIRRRQSILQGNENELESDDNDKNKNNIMFYM